MAAPGPLTIIILPEIDKRPIKPNLQPIILIDVLPRRNDTFLGDRLTRLGIELIRLNGLEPWIFAQTCHPGYELVRTDPGMQDGMQGGSVAGSAPSCSPRSLLTL